MTRQRVRDQGSALRRPPFRNAAVSKHCPEPVDRLLQREDGLKSLRSPGISPNVRLMILNLSPKPFDMLSYAAHIDCYLVQVRRYPHLLCSIIAHLALPSRAINSQEYG
jgi:hypothetical protein